MDKYNPSVDSSLRNAKSKQKNGSTVQEYLTITFDYN